MSETKETPEPGDKTKLDEKPALQVPTSCKECGSKLLTWHCDAQNRGGVQDGRIKMNEVGVIFFLGCDECSETLKIVDGNDIAALLTASFREDNP